MRMRFSYIVSLFLWALLTACGGGGGSGYVTAREAPGTVTVYATGLNLPMHMGFDDSGVLYTANMGGDNLAITQTTKSTSFLLPPSGVAWLAPKGLNFYDHKLYVSMSVGGSPGIWEINTSTGDATQPVNIDFQQSFNFSGFAFDANGAMYAADQTQNLVYWLDGAQNGSIPVTSPTGVAFLGGYIYVASYDASGSVKKIDPQSKAIVATLPGFFVNSYGIAMDSKSALYIVESGLNPNGSQSQIRKITSTGTSSVFAGPEKGLCASVGLVIRNDYVYVSNGDCTSDATKSNRILRIAI